MGVELEARAGLFRQAMGKRLREAGANMANTLAITMYIFISTLKWKTEEKNYSLTE